MSASAFIDGGQLFYAARKINRNSNINYFKLKTLIEDIAGDDVKINFFQAYNATLEPHRKLLNLLSKSVKFAVTTIDVPHSVKMNNMIFSSQIAHFAAKDKYRDAVDKIYIISSDPNLIEPALDMNAEIIFFKSQIHNKWIEYIDNGQIQLHDLDDMTPDLLYIPEKKEEETIVD